MREQINSETFSGQTFYIGLDVHKKTWKVSILTQERELRNFAMNPSAEELERYLRKNYPGGNYKAVYESGFCGFSAMRQLQFYGIDCKVIHAADVPSTQKDRLQKTDKADARRLAKCLRASMITPIYDPGVEQEAVRDLVRQRASTVKALSKVKNQVKSFLHKNGIPIPDQFTSSQTRNWSRNYMAWLENITHESPTSKLVMDAKLRSGKDIRAELLIVNRALRQRFLQPDYKQDYELLVKIPGIGPVVAMMILTEIVDMKRFPRIDELYSFVGFIPKMHQSGEKTANMDITSRGRKDIKVKLIEAAWVAIRHDPALLTAYQQWSKRMESNQAIVRVAKKLLSRIRWVLVNKKPYEIGVVK